jgi:hypothetical protein
MISGRFLNGVFAVIQISLLLVAGGLYCHMPSHHLLISQLHTFGQYFELMKLLKAGIQSFEGDGSSSQGLYIVMLYVLSADRETWLVLTPTKFGII